MSKIYCGKGKNNSKLLLLQDFEIFYFGGRMMRVDEAEVVV